MTAYDLAARILGHLETHPGDGPDALAQALHYSKHHLQHAFAEAMGLPLSEYALRRRLTRAARLLTSTRVPILDIALACGYESQQAFSAAFRAAYRCAPGHFRRERRFYPLQPASDAAALAATQAYKGALYKGGNAMNESGSMTALMSAFGRAYHCLNEKTPVFRDERARELFSDDEFAFIRSSILKGRDFFAPDAEGDDEAIVRRIVNEHIAPTPLCRAAYCESALAVARATGTLQYVILGAGLDTFAFRSTGFSGGRTVFEVDHPLTQRDKLARIERAGWPMPDNLRFVAVDFAQDSPRDRLLAAGFDPTKKTFFSWLGVSYYLTREQIDAFLAELASLCADGSSLVFDCAGSGFFDAPEPRVQKLIALACSSGEPMKSCFSRRELTRLLEAHGFLIYEELSPAAIQSSIIGDKCPGMRAFERISYVLAVHKALTAP
ncbi:MAG: SAM-dependent methyltransferase [Candidatus Fimadaptatus sp.]